MSVVIAVIVPITYCVPGHYGEASQCPGKLAGQSGRSGSCGSLSAPGSTQGCAPNLGCSQQALQPWLTEEELGSL